MLTRPIAIVTGLQKFLTPELRADGIAMSKEEPSWPAGPHRQKTLEQGCSTTLVAALDPELPSGAFLENCVVADPKPIANNQELAEKYWEVSEKIVGETFSY
jgi:hypothetical protein